MIDISRLGVGITKGLKGCIKINIGTIQKMTVLRNVRSGLDLSATNRGRGGEDRATDPRIDRVRGTSDPTTGTVRSGIGRTTDPDGSMTSTIGMNGLGTTTGGDLAAAADRDTAGEHQVTTPAGCTSFHFEIPAFNIS